MPSLFSGSSAVISECQLYRYRLSRSWREGLKACWIMLNPSVADADQDDPTIRKVIGFSRRIGCGQLVVVNLFAFRATDPKNMKLAANPVGPDNDAQILAAAKESDRIICAWGANGDFLERAKAVKEILTTAGLSAECLGLTKDGHPKHPLFLASATKLVPFI